MIKLAKQQQYRDRLKKKTLTDGLASFWSFDETSGSVAYDSHGNADGANNAVAINRTGKINKAYEITGDGANIDFGTVTRFTKAVSFSLWVKWNGGTGTAEEDGTIILWDSTMWIRIVYPDGDKVLQWYYNPSSWTHLGNWYNDGVGFPIDEWVHIGLSWDFHSGISKIVINGILENNKTGVYGKGVDGSATFKVGYGNTWTFKGLIDSFCYWHDRALSEDDFKVLYNNGNGLSYSNMQGIETTATDRNSNFYIDITDVTASEEITVGFIVYDGTYITIDWGDGNSETLSNTASRIDVNHTYASAGDYTIVIGKAYNLETFNIPGTNSPYFPVIASSIPKNLKIYNNWRGNTSGDSSDLPSGLVQLILASTNSLDITLSDLNSDLEVFGLYGNYNSLSGDLSHFNKMGQIIITASNSFTITGDITDLDISIVHAWHMSGNNYKNSYIGNHTFAPNIWRFIHLPNAGYGLTSTEVDNILIDLDNSGMSSGTIDISGNNAPRTSASNTAVASLQSKGVTVTVNTVLTEGLISWWKLDGDVQDYSGNNYHATNYGATVTSGYNQQAYSFDGSGTIDGTVAGDYISVPESITKTDTSTYPAGCTYSFWLNVDTDAVDRMSLLFGAPVKNHIEIFSISKNFRTEATTENGYSFGSGPFPDDVRGQWSYFTIVFTNNGNRDVMWYQNGVLFYTGDMSSGTNPNGEYFSFNKLGRSTGTTSYQYSKSFDGKLQDIRIYNRVLSSDEILALYNRVY